MTASFQHVELTITFTTPDGRKRAAIIPAEPAQVDPNDSIGTMSMILVALNDRVARLETITADLLAVMKPFLEPSPLATMDAAAAEQELDDREMKVRAEEQASLFDEETVAGVDRFDV
jgi:hypothetical protein